MKPWFVVNPHAGSVPSGALTAAIRRRLEGREAIISGELPPAASQDRLVVAVGGDGTINRVINGCDPRQLRLGIVPRGSANDLGAELGIPSDFQRAWHVLETGACEQIDLISVNGSRFATCGGFGLATEVAARANRWKGQPRWRGRATRRLGPLVYVLAALSQLRQPPPRGIPVTLRVGGVRHRLRLGAALVSNQPCFGRWFSASPLASNRDGLLQVDRLLHEFFKPEHNTGRYA
jgi:diacylglycerol kinase family enzyme